MMLHTLSRGHRAFLIGGVFAATLFLIFAAFHLIAPPKLTSGNLLDASGEMAEVASNAPLEFGFNSQWIPTGFFRKGFKLFPEVGGRFEGGFSRVTFYPEERFKVGETYTLTLSPDIRNILGRSLGAEIVLKFLVTDPPRVALALPNAETPPESKITVMFDRPMTELTTYDEAESRPFPLTIDPPEEGRFKWIGTSALQFIPKERLHHSTQYTGTIPAGTAALDGGTLPEDFTFTFSTPRIQITQAPLDHALSGHEPYRVTFNQAVDLVSLETNTRLTPDAGNLRFAYAKHTEVTYDDQGREQKKEVIDPNIAEILPASGDWGYENSYRIEVAAGVAGAEGNLFTESPFAEDFQTLAFLTDKFPRHNEEYVGPASPITLYFDQPADLGSARAYFSLTPAADFKITYGKKCDPKWEPQESPDEPCDEVEDVNTIVFTPEKNLLNRQKYTAVLSREVRAQNGKTYLKEDARWDFTTADTFSVLRTDPPHQGRGSYSRLCLFTTNEPDPNEIEKQLSFSPGLKSFSAITYSLDDDYHRCKRFDSAERYALEISALLNPDTDYTVTLKGDTHDVFDQSLGQDFRFSYRTEPLKDEDTVLRLLQDTRYAASTPDQHAAPVFMTRNLETFDLEVCRLTAEGFLEIETKGRGEHRYRDSWSAFEPSTSECADYKSAPQPLKRLPWESQYTEVRLADFLGRAPEPGYYFIRASSPRTYWMQPTYENGVRTGETKVYTRPFQILSLSNLHLALKHSPNYALLWATDLSKGQPASGVQTTLYSHQGKVISGTASKTNSQGLTKVLLDGTEFQYALAKLGNDSLALNKDWEEGLSPWTYGLDYSPSVPYVQGYVYTDRPLYRPTHQVFFKGLAREDFDATLKLPRSQKVYVTIRDAEYNSVFEKEAPLSKAGAFEGSFTLDQAAPLGRYGIEVCLQDEDGACDSSFYQSFFVEEYRKPEYQLKAAFSQPEYLNGETLSATLQAHYFFGAPVSKATIDWSLVSQNYYFDEYQDEWFSFTEGDTFYDCYYGCPFSDESVASGSGAVNPDGSFALRHGIDLSKKDANGKVQPPETSKIYTLHATVQDANHQTVSTRESVIVHRGEFYVGVKTLDYFAKAGESMPIQVIAVSPQGEPLHDKSVRVNLYQLDWKTVKKKNVDGGFYWDNERTKKLVKRVTLLTGADGKASEDLLVKEGGEYLVEAEATDARLNTIRSTVNFYVTTYDEVRWRQENNSRMELKTDKKNYRVGDTARILIMSPYKNVKALLTLERGEVMETRVIDIASNADIVEIPITEKMLPNFYVSVLEVKGGDKNDPPDMKLGLVNLVVDAADKILAISIKTDKKQYGPGEKVRAEITTADAKGVPIPADLSLAVVDASLLALKGNPKRDLVNYFYNRRSLGVLTASTMTQLLKRIELPKEGGAKGGGGGGGEESPQPRGEFKDTAFWRAELRTDASGKASVEFTLPDNLTTWNLEAIGSTADSLFGDANETVITQKPVIVRPLLPRFARFKDELHLGAIVHNFTDQDDAFTVTLKTENLDLKDRAEKAVRIPANGSATVLWSALAPQAEIGDRAALTLTALAKGGLQDSVRQELPLLSYSTPETVATSSFTDDVSFTEKVQVPPAVDRSLGSLTLKTGATLATYLSDALNYLLGFPYGCSEQTMSQLIANAVVLHSVALPNLKDKNVIKPILNDKGKPVDFDTLAETGLQRLYATQRSDGGWGYFSGSDESYPYLTAYIVFGLDRLQRADFNVDSGVLSRAAAFLREYMLRNDDLKDSKGQMIEKSPTWANTRAYLLHALAEAGGGDLGLTNNLYDDRQLLSNAGKIYTALTLKALNGPERKIKTLLQDLENQARIDPRGTYLRNDESDSFSMMTHVKTTALMIQLLTRTQPDHPLLPSLIRWLIASRKDGHWSTTQENAAALIALTEFLEKSRETEAAYQAKAKLNGQEILTYSVTPETILGAQEVTRAIRDLEDTNELIFTKDGQGRLYYDMTLRYFLPAEAIASRSEGFEIRREYFRLDDEKMERPVTEAVAGETLRGHLTIITPDERRLTAVEAFLPAGFELVNFEFDTADRNLMNANQEESEWYYASPWNHKEFRDDRLFLFADHLPAGVYEYDYYVNVTSEGSFRHPPAVVSEMYFPENFARTRGEVVKVKGGK